MVVAHLYMCERVQRVKKSGFKRHEDKKIDKPNIDMCVYVWVSECARDCWWWCEFFHKCFNIRDKSKRFASCHHSICFVPFCSSSFLFLQITICFGDNRMKSPIMLCATYKIYSCFHLVPLLYEPIYSFSLLTSLSSARFFRYPLFCPILIFKARWVFFSYIWFLIFLTLICISSITLGFP